MSDPGASFGGGTGDPVISFIAMARDAWVAGLSALQLMAQQAGAGPTGAPYRPPAGGDPLSAFMALATGLTGAMNEFVLPAAAARPGSGPAPAIFAAESLSAP